MAAFEDVTVEEFIKASKSAKSIQTRRKLAEAFVKGGITSPSTALLTSRIKTASDWGVSDSLLYTILRESPGFAWTHDKHKRLRYYYEADIMLPYAAKQGCEYYPDDLSAIGYSLANETDEKRQAIKPLWEIDPEKAEVGLATVPYREGVNVEELTKVMGQFMTRIEEAPVRRMLIRNLVGLEVDSRKGLE